MRKKTKGSLCLSVALIASCLWESLAMTANAQEWTNAVRVEAIEVTPSGTQTISGNTVEKPEGTAGAKTADGAENDNALQTIAQRSQIYGRDITFDADSEWSDQGEYNIALTTAKPLKSGARVTMDIILPEAAAFEGSIKIQGVARLGMNWDWTQAPVIPELTADSFTAADSGYKKASVEFVFGDEITADYLAQFTIKLAGYKCNYSGAVYAENISLYDGGGSGELKPADDAVIDDFENYNINETGGWAKEAGWQYDAEVGIAVAEFNETKALKLDLDYTGKKEVSWSEAKIAKTFERSYDVANYNCLTMDFYFPAEFSSNSLKLFADGLINNEAVIEVTEELDSGYKKAQATVKFTPSDKALESLTIGIVGVNTEFKGSVYLDNLVLKQYSTAGEYVEITSVPGAGSRANISNAPSSVKMADKNADASASALYAYLFSLSGNNQVLFGHENDYNKAVSATAAEGDVKEVTGSLSGMYGIDTLSLTGAELGITDANLAMETAAANSIAAANQGAIITLSAHMPNFTNSKITQNADGSYNFTSCDFSESKDLSNDCAQQILPGGAYHAQYNAYLDIIADYAKRLQEQNIPVIFRPFHENNGSWFWWGSGTSVETYKSIFRYAVEYLQASGVHNMIYVYSPNGPFSSESKYMERYPGDEYVDILAFDYYDDYNTYPAASDGSFFNGLDTSCGIVEALASARGKIAAISETGVRVMKADGSDNEGLLVSGNPVAQSKSGTNWYQKVCDIADAHGMPYYLVWANFGDTNFYVPYKYDDQTGHEMINEFIDFYNSDKSIFANGTNFYGQVSAAATAYTNPYGYMIAPFEAAVIKEGITLRASVQNGNKVEFVVTNTENGEKVVLNADKAEDTIINEYRAALSNSALTQLGQTDSGQVSLAADGTTIAVLNNISFGKEKEKAPANMIENFEYYAGSNGLLSGTYVENSAGGCSSEFILNTENKSDGAYSGEFKYKLETTGNEVWTGRVKTLENNDYSQYNAITMWVKPDGKAQKVVVQIADGSGEEYEVYLTDFAKGTEAKYITVPFSSFKGKNGGTLDTAKIMKFAVWCNSILPDGHTGAWEVDSSLYFDGIQGITAGAELLKQVDENGLIITDESQVPNSGDDDDKDEDDNKGDDDQDDANKGGDDDQDDANKGGDDSKDDDNKGHNSTGGSGNSAGSQASYSDGRLTAATDYAAFNNVCRAKIEYAVKDAKIVVDAAPWVSFHKSVLKALAERPDVTVTINYKYQQKYYSVTIPAGADVMKLADKEGFCGFRYLDTVFGGYERKASE